MKEIAQCRACKANIIWMKTKIGNAIPVDYQDGIAHLDIFDPRNTAMIAHFSTCPQTEKFRNKK